jgi:hypothetical protein
MREFKKETFSSHAFHEKLFKKHMATQQRASFGAGFSK